MKTRKPLTLTAAALAACLGLSACAGSVGNNTTAADGGDGVPLGATDEQYQEALADLPETTLTFQPTGASPEVIAAPRALEFKERVEEASGGKITIELVWGQAIAGYSEVDDALVDGRVDIAATLPIYNPAEYPVNGAFVSGTTLAGASPRLGDLAANAAMLEVAWNSEELIEEFESKGLEVLMPFHVDGNQMVMCSEPITSPADWQGRQVRVSSAIQSQQIEALGATPVSLEFPELYEALQRGTIDCAMAHGAMATGVGFMDVAPHSVYSDEVAFAPGPLSIMAGTDYAALPLAARQLIFDSLETVFEQQRITSLQGSVNVAAHAQENNGTLRQMDESSVQKLTSLSQDVISADVSDGVVPEGFDGRIDEALQKWSGIVEEMDLGDEGDFATLHEWHDDEDVELLAPFAERVYDDVMAAHRPS